MKINVSLKSAKQVKVDIHVQGYLEGSSIPAALKKKFKGASGEAIIQANIGESRFGGLSAEHGQFNASENH